MRVFSLLILFLLVGCGGQQQPIRSNTRGISKTQKTPFETLRGIDMFAFGRVTDAGIRSEGEVAFRTVITNSNALELFDMVLTNGTTEAKLYALCALRRLSPHDFERQTPNLDTKANVGTMQGCFVMGEPAADTLKRIRAGYYDDFILDALK